jgi:UDP:flavonoid glycosyltransferase YjiC (YdhE family)
MPKIIVLANGTQGDVQPAVALSSYLNTRGYDVTICGGLNIKDLADSHECRFIPMGEDNEAFVARAPDPTKQPMKATRALTQ